MNSSVLRQMRARRRIAWLLAIAILLAGIAQAAHFHKNELSGAGGADVHCLLCLYAASGATPPAPPELVAAAALSLHAVPCSHGLRFPQDHSPASYDARGPPAV